MIKFVDWCIIIQQIPLFPLKIIQNFCCMVMYIKMKKSICFCICAFYYARSHAEVDYSRFMNAIASMVWKLTPEILRKQPGPMSIFWTMKGSFFLLGGRQIRSISGVLSDNLPPNQRWGALPYFIRICFTTTLYSYHMFPCGHEGRDLAEE